MFKKTIALSLALSFAFCAFGCNKKPGSDIDGIAGNTNPNPTAPASASTNANASNKNENNSESEFPPVAMENGWPKEGIFCNVPPYTYAGELGEPLMPDTYLIPNSTIENFNAYCKDLENAGFTKAVNASEDTITRYIFENAGLNLAVTCAYWTEYKEIEILAETLDGSIDYSNKPTINITWDSNEYLKVLPEYKQGGRIIDVSSSRAEGSEQDFIKIADAKFEDYNNYKAALLAAGFVQGNPSHEGWHTESYYYSHPDHPQFTAELYYELNGTSTENIIIGIYAMGRAII